MASSSKAVSISPATQQFLGLLKFNNRDDDGDALGTIFIDTVEDVARKGIDDFVTVERHADYWLIKLKNERDVLRFYFIDSIEQAKLSKGPVITLLFDSDRHFRVAPAGDILNERECRELFADFAEKQKA